ncbi:MAG: FliO/MopB family protein [Candidatus Sericytochromatia bacterium]|nr:FliO/MopB family protein [Candidatus Tanganyikabacteria bacterium]
MTLLTVSAAATASTWLASPPPAPAADFSVWQLLLNLLVVCGILGLMAWGAMVLLRGRLALPVGLKARAIRVEDRLPIDPQRSILILGVGDRRWLVGMTAYGFNPIAELDDGEGFEKALVSEVSK